MIKMGMEASVRGTIPKGFNYVSDYSEDYKGSGVRTKRKAVRDTRWRWPGAEIPYLFAKGHFSKALRVLPWRSHWSIVSQISPAWVVCMLIFHVAVAF